MDAPCEAANYDEVSMQQSLLFSDSLKDLKNLRKQLYSAAEYFEFSYTNDNEKQAVVNTLKDYAIKALVNTVDHLGYVSCKVNGLLDDKVDEASGVELGISCIHQRLQTCQEYTDREGISQQSLQMNAPNYCKRYILPLGETMRHGVQTKSKFEGCMIQDQEDWDQFKNAIRATMQESPLLSDVSKRLSQSAPLKVTQKGESLSFNSLPNNKPTKDSGRRTDALPRRFPFFRSSSLSIKALTPRSSQSSTPNKSRPTTPNPSAQQQFYISEPRKSASALMPESPKDSEELSRKSKRLLKSLLSRRKSRRDNMLYTYLDEY